MAVELGRFRRRFRLAAPLRGRPPVAVDLPGPRVDPNDGAAVARAAAQRLPAGDVRIAVAREMASYTAADHAQVVAALERLPQNRAVVTFNLGVAEIWNGDLRDGTASLEHTLRLDPYGYYGTRADGLLFGGRDSAELVGYPPFFEPSTHSLGSLASLRARTRANPGDVAAWLALAAGLERSDRAGALAAARQALRIDPNGVSPRVAVAVLGFNKLNPSAAVGTLATMAAGAPSNAEVQFHLGILFFWIRRFDDAAARMRFVLAKDPQGPYSTLARVFERCLTSSASCQQLIAGAR